MYFLQLTAGCSSQNCQQQTCRIKASPGNQLAGIKHFHVTVIQTAPRGFCNTQA